MATRPDLLLPFAPHLAEQYAAWGFPGLEIRAEAYAALNGRAYGLLVDPSVDLAAQPRSLAPAPWILPLAVPLYPPSAAVHGSR